MDQGEYLYDAFISYRRSDGTSLAAWLRRRLQDYRLPPALAKTHKKLRVYLDTAFERANEDFWNNNIEPALRSSRHLIVIATPDTLRPQATGKPNWVEREIELFLSLPQGKNALVVRAKGEFNAELPARLLERFPRMTMVDLRTFSPGLDRFYLRQSLREHLLTILGTVHDIESEQMPELRMEDARNARNAALRLATIAIFLFVLISALAITAVIQRNSARDERNIAQANAAQSRARELAVYAGASLNQDPERSLLLAIEAVKTTLQRNEPTVRAAENALQDAVFHSLSRVTLHGHSGHVNTVALSADGSRAATGGADKTARIWDTSTGAVLLTLQDFAGPVNAVAFSPDGRRLATGSQVTLTFSRDAKIETTTGRPEETVRIWDAVTGQRVLTLQGAWNSVSAVAFSPDGMLVATGGDGKIQLWNAVTGQWRHTLSGHSSLPNAKFYRPVAALSFSQNSRYLATNNPDLTATIWDTSSGKEVLTVREGATSITSITSVALSPDGKVLATAAGNEAKLWDASTGWEGVSRTGHSNAIDAIGFSPDGRYLATGSWDKTARIWSVDTGMEATLRGHSDFVVAVAFSRDGTRLATASWDGSARIWDAVRGPELVTLKEASVSIPMKAAFSPDGSRIAVSSENNLAKVWDIASGKELVTLRGHAGDIEAVTFSRDGKFLATGSRDNTAKVWNATTGTELAAVRATGSTMFGKVSAVAFSADHRHLATGDGDGTVSIWDGTDGREMLNMRGHSNFVTALAFSSDGTRLASGSVDETVKIWNAIDGKELLTLRGHSNIITKVVFSPDGRRLATSAADGTIRVWEAANGQELSTVQGHQESANDVAFSPDGTRLATASTDGTVKIWSADTGQEVMTLQSYLGALFKVAFNLDGRHLSASSFDSVQTYTLDVQELLRIAQSRIGRRPPGFTPQECRQYFPSPSQPCPIQSAVSTSRDCPNGCP